MFLSHVGILCGRHITILQASGSDGGTFDVLTGTADTIACTRDELQLAEDTWASRCTATQSVNTSGAVTGVQYAAAPGSTLSVTLDVGSADVDALTPN